LGVPCHILKWQRDVVLPRRFFLSTTAVEQLFFTKKAGKKNHYSKKRKILPTLSAIS
jgi:hypothetical protein